jgi:hypothetical protein
MAASFSRVSQEHLGFFGRWIRRRAICRRIILVISRGVARRPPAVLVNAGR